MYELNGIMIVGEITPELKVVNARATNDWMMLVTFSNGETRVFDGTSENPSTNRCAIKRFSTISPLTTPSSHGTAASTSTPTTSTT